MPMTTEQMVALGRLLDEALELEPAQHDAWLAGLAQEHLALLPLLREILAERESEQAQDFLAAGPRLSEGEPAEVGSAAMADSLVGPYRLLRELGHGGMGTVWLAERVGEGLRRQVALKLPRLMWDAGLAERMARERDIAAVLEHPSIARLYDAGLDEQGRSYLAFEYIDGQPIDTWCNKRKLGVRERLKLVVEVTRAVAYAHGRLVVHRDIKPSNVLVTADGHAHLLDFGIAKLLAEGAQDTGATGLTQELGRMLTPTYASPEHIRGEPITVASDVYSLGVLSYELLTGSAPYRPKRASQAALEEEILEGEAALASTQAPDKATARALQGEVDAILAKALKHEPGKRYATADALADDIERHLTGERVLAQPDSTWYRLSKALRRHWIGVSAVSAVVAAVVLGSVVALVQAQRADAAARQAGAEALRARAVTEFVVDVFRVNARDDPANNELRRLPAQLILEHGAKLIATKFQAHPQVQAELYGVVGELFANLAEAELALEYANKHLQALAQVHSTAEEQVRALRLKARALNFANQPLDALASIQHAFEIAPADAALKLELRMERASMLFALSRDQAGNEELMRAESEAASLQPLPANLQATLLMLRARCTETCKLEGYEGDLAAATEIYERALSISISAGTTQALQTFEIREALLRNLAYQKRNAETKSQLAATLESMRSFGGNEDIRAAFLEARMMQMLFENSGASFEEMIDAVKRDWLIIASNERLPAYTRARMDFQLGDSYADGQDVERAYPLLSQSSQVLLKAEQSPRQRQYYIFALGVTAMFAGHHSEADELLRQAVELRRSLYPQPERWQYASQYLARNLSMQGRFEEAESVLTSADMNGPSRESDDIKKTRARVMLDRGNASAALNILPRFDDFDSMIFDQASLLRGEALCALGKAREGLTLIEAFIRGHSATTYAHNPSLARVRAMAGLCALKLGTRGRAVEYARLAHEAFTDQPNTSPYYRLPLQRLDEQLSAESATIGAWIPGSPTTRQWSGTVLLVARRGASRTGKGLSWDAPIPSAERWNPAVR